MRRIKSKTKKKNIKTNRPIGPKLGGEKQIVDSFISIELAINFVFVVLNF